jgi:hypothetical protein
MKVCSQQIEILRNFYLEEQSKDAIWYVKKMTLLDSCRLFETILDALSLEHL